MTSRSMRSMAWLGLGLLLAGCTPSVWVNTLVPLDEIDGISVEAETTTKGGRTGLNLVVTNDGTQPWLIDWDQSSYVMPGGGPERLRVTPVVEPQREQIPSPLPPESQLRQFCYNQLVSRRQAAGTDSGKATLNLALVQGDELRLWRGTIEIGFKPTSSTEPEDRRSWAR